jgi:hypothetical protein
MSRAYQVSFPRTRSNDSPSHLGDAEDRVLDTIRLNGERPEPRQEVDACAALRS